MTFSLVSFFLESKQLRGTKTMNGIPKRTNNKFHAMNPKQFWDPIQQEAYQAFSYILFLPFNMENTSCVESKREKKQYVGVIWQNEVE